MLQRHPRGGGNPDLPSPTELGLRLDSRLRGNDGLVKLFTLRLRFALGTPPSLSFDRLLEQIESNQ